MLGEVRNYLRQRGSATLREISAQLGASESTTRLALDYWIGKGRIRVETPPCNSCSSRSGCAGEMLFYCWTDQDTV